MDVPPGRNPMFVYDEQLTDLIFEYCRWRLSLDPVPLDYGGALTEPLAARLDGLINAHGTDPSAVMELFDKVLVDAECTHDGSIKHLMKFLAGIEKGLQNSEAESGKGEH